MAAALSAGGGLCGVPFGRAKQGRLSYDSWLFFHYYYFFSWPYLAVAALDVGALVMWRCCVLANPLASE